MSVGILIFVISVIISIITTMRENSHKDRQNQKPPQKHLPIMNQKRWLFEEIERTFKEISEELNEEEKKSSKRKYDDTLPPLFDELPKEEPKSKPVVEPMAPKTTRNKTDDRETNYNA